MHGTRTKIIEAQQGKVYNNYKNTRLKLLKTNAVFLFNKIRKTKQMAPKSFRKNCTFVGHNKVKWSRYRPGVAQRVGGGIALLFHDRGTRRGWAVSSTPRQHFTPGKDAVSILQGAGWAPDSVWTGEKNLVPTGIRSWTVQLSVQNKIQKRNKNYFFGFSITYCGKLNFQIRKFSALLINCFDEYFESKFIV